jgi:lambda family phage tail tape measure protein
VLGSDLLFVFERFVAVFGRFELGFFASKEAVKAFWESYNKESEEARKNLDLFQAKILGLNKSSDADAQEGYGKGAKLATERVMELNKQQQQMLAMTKLISVEYERQQQFALQQLQTRNAMAGRTENERRIQESVNKVLEETSKKIDDITKRREEAVQRKAGTEVIAEYDRQIIKIQEIGDRFANLTRYQETQAIQAQRTFEYGWNKAFKQFAEDSYNYAKIADDVFKSVTNSMSSAIDKFVETGKFSFKDFAQSVIQDLIKIQLKAQATQIFSSAGGGLGGIFGSLFGGGGGTPDVSSMAGYSLFADGGHIASNQPALVGENGPELFIPQRSGTIVPNQQMSSMAGDKPTIVYNGPYIQNMSAIDTQSATQFLAKNKNAVWSANQSASRGMPTSR